MNEHGLPPDELASAFLDDELAGSAADPVRSDPELTARVDELRQAAGAVGAPVTPPPGAADAAVEAALADFDARRTTTLEPAAQRSRRLSLITGVAAAVAIGFIVAAAIGLFSESDDANDTATSAAAAPALPADAAPAPEPAPAPDSPAPPPPAAEPPSPAIELEPAPAPAEAAAASAEAAAAEATAREALQTAEAALAAAELAQATAEGNQEAVAAAEAALAEAHAAADDARAEAAAAQEEAAAGREAASAAQAEASEAQAADPTPPPSTEPPPPAPADVVAEPEVPPADGGDMAADDMAGEPSVGSCDAAIDDGTVELQITAGETPVLIIRTIDERLVALNSTTCAEIPPDDPTDITTDPPPDDCAAAIGDGTVELQITAGETRVLVVRTPDGQPTALDGATCSEIPPEEQG